MIGWTHSSHYLVLISLISNIIQVLQRGCYSILELFDERSHYISIKFPLHKPSEEDVLITKTGYCLRLYGNVTNELDFLIRSTHLQFGFNFLHTFEFIASIKAHIFWQGIRIIILLSKLKRNLWPSQNIPYRRHFNPLLIISHGF